MVCLVLWLLWCAWFWKLPKFRLRTNQWQNKFEESSLQFGDRSFLILSKNANIKVCRTIIVSIPLGHETWAIAVREEHIVGCTKKRSKKHIWKQDRDRNRRKDKTAAWRTRSPRQKLLRWRTPAGLHKRGKWQAWIIKEMRTRFWWEKEAWKTYVHTEG